jgi:polysaccharide chain length determinant protein (PEP-CTERM system associated)
VLPGRKYTPNDIARLLFRQAWLVLPLAVIGLAVGMFLFRHLPKQYRSETLIMLVPQRVPDAYVKSTVTAKVEDRLASISDQIMSRSRLERVVTDFDLYPKERATGIMEDVVQRMRRDIDVTLEGKKESFRVSYVSGDPKTAQKVTERLASLYIEENLRDRANLADDTNQFLASQLEDAKRRLLEHEKKLKEYRERYAGQLPTQLQGSLQAIQTAQMQLQAINESSNRARERRLLIERQLADAQALPAAAAASPATPENPPVLTAAQQLEAAQSRLELYKQRFTEDHPDMKALHRLIAELQAKADEEAKRPASAAPLTTAEVARRKRISDLQAELDVIDHQIASNAAEETRLKKVIATYQADVDAVPARESELVELTRDYGTLQATYASLLEKQEGSKLAANLERRQIGETFKVLDPASLPERPFNQNKRLGALVGGLVGGVVLGLLVVGFLEYRDSSFRTEDELRKLLALPVLALIPQVTSDQERREQHRRMLAARVTAAVVFLIGSAATVVFWRGQL